MFQAADVTLRLARLIAVYSRSSVPWASAG
jgi:hypothetical protein